MTMTSPPYALQQGSHSAQLFREAIGSLLGQSGGIVQPSDLAVTQNGTPNMSVNVGPGRIWVPSTYTATVNPGGGAYYPGGLYYAENDASVNLPISASNPTNPRIDQIIAQVQDAAYTGSTNSAQLAVLTGTATAGASLTNLVGLASVPASSLVLAYVLVPANATSIVTGDISNAASVAKGANALSFPSVATPTRAANTAYQPSTTRPVLVVLAVDVTISSSAPSGGVQLLIGPTSSPTTEVSRFFFAGASGVTSGGAQGTCVALLPPGYYYEFGVLGTGSSLAFQEVVEYTL